MTKKRSSRRLVMLSAAVMALLLAEAALLGLVFLVPGAESRLRGVGASLERAWSGSERSPGVRGRVGDALRGTYDGWIAPLWRQPDPPEGDPEFRECVSCHADYASQRRFTAVYMDHPLHAEIGVACADCHRDTTHPNPLPVPEEACAECHEEVKGRNGCGLCHPPASLPHFYLLGAPREGPVECNACHEAFRPTTPTEPLVDPVAFDGSERRQCSSCHETSSCQRCHAERHPANWVATHGEPVGYGGDVACYACHTMSWCADRCHAVTPGRPFAPRPLPPGEAP